MLSGTGSALFILNVVGLVFSLRLVSLSYVCWACMPSSEVASTMLQIGKLGLDPASYTWVPAGLYVDYYMAHLLVY